jgi:shikimate dehydrogenase/chorismate mutase-like protein
MNQESLNEFRSRIEDLDMALLKLLNERAVVSTQIGRLKAENGLNIYDHHREESIFKYLAEQNKGPLKDSEVNRIFYEIISVSRQLQSDMAGGNTESGVRGDTGMLSGTTSIYGILGNPVAHSMSPRMHNAAFRLLGIDAIYLPFEVEDLPGAVSGMKALGIRGASVTIPFKTEVFGLINDIDNTAERIGAVNTLVFSDGRIRGTNTDWIGAVRCLETMLPIEGHRFVVIGTGGAARAVIYGIVTKGGEAIIVGRSENKGQALAGEFDCAFVPFREIENARGDCLVNTTPVGMHPKEDEMPVSTHILRGYKAVADIIYNPLKTKLLREAEAAGCMVASGLEMFVFQGTEQFHIWTGQEPPVELMRQVVLEKLTSGQ